METSIEGIFAAGDVTNSEVKQVVTASAQGAIAGKSVHDFLKLKQ
jgi:thioredoxin reductase